MATFDFPNAEDIGAVLLGVLQQHVIPFLNPKPVAEKKVLTRKQLMAKLEISSSTLRNWTLSGKIQTHKGGGRRVYFFEDEVLSALRNQD